MPSEEFTLYTSIRYDPQLLTSAENGSPSPFYNFLFHYERLINALDHFAWSKMTSESTYDAGSYPSSRFPVRSLEAFRSICEEAVDNWFKDSDKDSTFKDKSNQALMVRICKLEWTANV